MAEATSSASTESAEAASTCSCAGPGSRGYLDRLGLDRGTLVLFDRRHAAPPIDARTRFEAATTPKGRAIKVLRA